MSIRIHNAFRIPNASLDEAFALVQSFRPVVAKRAREDMARDFARHLVREIDVATLEPSGLHSRPDRPSNYEGAWAAIQDEIDQWQAAGTRCPTFDCEFSVTLFPAGNHVLGVTRTDRTDWDAEMLALPGVEEYAYQDAGDRPEEISAEAWEARRLDWLPILDGGWNEDLLRGINVILHPARGPKPAVEDLLPQVPPLFARAGTAAGELVFRRAWYRAEQEYGAKVLALWRTARAYERTPEGRAELESVTLCAMEALQPEITVGTLLEGVERTTEGAKDTTLL
jgi:hypothetical protein